MTVENLTNRMPDAISEGKKMPYALIRGMSRVTFGRTPSEFDSDDLLEAVFFSKIESIRLFRRDGELQSVRITEEADDTVIEVKYKIANPEFGKNLTVHKQIGFDEDGQAYVRTAYPVGWEGASENA